MLDDRIISKHDVMRTIKGSIAAVPVKTAKIIFMWLARMVEDMQAFVESHSEYCPPDTSRFENKILILNKLNNK